MSSKSPAKEQAHTPGRDDAAAPYELVLELARAEDADDPFGFRFVEQTYLLRQQGGAYMSRCCRRRPSCTRCSGSR